MKLGEQNLKKYSDFKLLKIIKLQIFLIIIIIILSLIFFSAGCKPGKIIEEEASSKVNNTNSSGSENLTGYTEVIPAKITNLIKTADKYYKSGEYGLARNDYRKVEIAIDDSDLSKQTKQKLKASFYFRYKKVKEIIETAGIHYGNAMMLEYEQRYDEAKKELEAALAIYPKYDEALEAYENLKAIMGME